MTKNNNNELEKRNQAFLIYQDENGIARVNVRFEGEDVWLNVEQMMELFDASQQDVSYHINQIYDEGEQDPERTHKKFLLVRQEGNRSVRRNMDSTNNNGNVIRQLQIGEFARFSKLLTKWSRNY